MWRSRRRTTAATSTTPPEQESLGHIHEALGQVMRSIRPVGKGGENLHQDYKFRRIDDLMDELHGHLADAGVYIVPRLVDMERKALEKLDRGKVIQSGWLTVVKVAYEFTSSKDGSVRTMGPFPGEGADSFDKSSQKALTAALKYLLSQCFLVPYQGIAEGDEQSPETKTYRRPSKAEQLKVIGAELSKLASSPGAEKLPPVDGKKGKVDLPRYAAELARKIKKGEAVDFKLAVTIRNKLQGQLKAHSPSPKG